MTEHTFKSGDKVRFSTPSRTGVTGERTGTFVQLHETGRGVWYEVKPDGDGVGPVRVRPALVHAA
jgi:hypothetical protein